MTITNKDIQKALETLREYVAPSLAELRAWAARGEKRGPAPFVPCGGRGGKKRNAGKVA